MGVVEDLIRARETYERGDWAGAFAAWSALDPAGLDGDDLANLATSAYLVGRRAESTRALRRCFQLRVDAGDVASAARCAFWLGLVSANAGEPAVAAGWAARARRLLDDLGEDVVERGYLHVLEMFEHLARLDFPAIAVAAADVVAYGRRFQDPNLLAMGLSSIGRIRLYQGEVPEGLALLDEAMVGVAAGEVTPPLAGEVYCSMIEACQEIADLGRAVEWTAALSRWCDSQPGLLMFTGQCALHRGQIMKLRGEYAHALDEFTAAGERYRALGTPEAAGLASAERGDVLRLLGRLDAAEAEYERASGHGFEPQPGLALLWLARGRTEAARAAIARLLAETGEPVPRSRLLPVAVEVLLAAGDAAGAREAAREFDGLADRFGCTGLLAMAAHTAGRVEVEAGDAAGALPYLRKAMRRWTALGCPYEVARVEVLVGRACAALGDVDSSEQHFDAAEREFSRLGTAPAMQDLRRRHASARAPGGLTGREVEVLRLVAAGKSNAQIARTLVLSERTVARHLSNIFAKIGVPSRTAAAAYAYEHGLG